MRRETRQPRANWRQRCEEAGFSFHSMGGTYWDESAAYRFDAAQIDQLESDADRAMRTGITKLFREEPDVRQLIKMKGIYELLESVTDRAEDVANIIEGIILENS